MLQAELRRAEFLNALYELSGGNPLQGVETVLVGQKISMEEPEISQVGHYLKEEGLVDYYSFGNMSITHKGRKLVESSMADTHARREFEVLKKIYDLSEQNTAKPVFMHQLEAELGMGWQEVTAFCKGLQQKDLVEWPEGVDSYLFITITGIEAIKSPGQPKSGGDTYNIGTIHAAQIGSHNTQNVQINITNNPEFDQAIKGLLELIEASNVRDKDELREEVV